MEKEKILEKARLSLFSLWALRCPHFLIKKPDRNEQVYWLIC